MEKDGWWKQEEDWQWEFHVIPFGMEGMLRGGNPQRHKQADDCRDGSSE